MSQGAAPTGVAAGSAAPPMNYTPEVPATPASGGMVGEGAAPPAQGPGPEPPGLWDNIKGMLGQTAGDFVQMLGDSPEERQTNMDAFNQVMKTINGLGAGLSKTTLVQRLGKQRGIEMVQQQRQNQAMAAQAMQPMPTMTPDQVMQMLNNVGLGVRGIQDATRTR